mmetsp:Transcript_127377/g.220396  ORF Transcript_127377/g.220396 Transcript_127377/m.220396 type:complete len:133 (-) Transcript_127377:1552-1950(-)
MVPHISAHSKVSCSVQLYLFWHSMVESEACLHDELETANEWAADSDSGNSGEEGVDEEENVDDADEGVAQAEDADAGKGMAQAQDVDVDGAAASLGHESQEDGADGAEEKEKRVKFCGIQEKSGMSQGKDFG